MSDKQDASDAATAPTRRARIAEAITEYRRAGAETPVLLAAATGTDPPYVEYRDREITVTVDGAGRERLEELLEQYPVFKVAQPATNKAPAGEVHLSALADPKHAADFLDDLFLSVFAVGPEYELRIETA